MYPLWVTKVKRSQCGTKLYSGRLSSNLCPSHDETNLMPNLNSLRGKNYSRKGGPLCLVTLPVEEGNLSSICWQQRGSFCMCRCWDSGSLILEQSKIFHSTSLQHTRLVKLLRDSILIILQLWVFARAPGPMWCLILNLGNTLPYLKIKTLSFKLTSLLIHQNGVDKSEHVRLLTCI